MIRKDGGSGLGIKEINIDSGYMMSYPILISNDKIEKLL
jgi:hypothetical protein